MRSFALEIGNWYSLQLRFEWKANEVFVVTNLGSYICQTGALSPAPSDVRNFTLHSAMVVGSNATIVNTSWLPPLHANGKLSNYLMCVSPKRLSGTEDSGFENLCVNITVSVWCSTSCS